MPVLRIASVILFALSCASCSGSPGRPESELSHKVVGNADISSHCGEITAGCFM